MPSGLTNVCAFNPEKIRQVLASLIWRTAAVLVLGLCKITIPVMGVSSKVIEICTA
jgi:hypothetical protein